jgi:ABC-type Fe3+/spermidine/putrescine transport system ATPase subunit
MAISDRIAVMKKGRILQVGSPYELYMHPEQIFVANFIGESNFLEGRVTEIEDEVTMVRLRGDLMVKAKRNSEAQRDDRVVLAVRPEAFEMVRGHVRLANSVNGVVERVRFEGTDIRYEVRLANDDSIIVVRPSLGGEWLKETEKVTLGFPPEKSHMFLYPPKGLMNELELE